MYSVPAAPWVKDAARREAHQLPIEDLIRLTKGGSAVAGGIPSVEELCASRRTARGNSGGPCLGAVSSGNPVTFRRMRLLANGETHAPSPTTLQSTPPCIASLPGGGGRPAPWYWKDPSGPFPSGSNITSSPGVWSARVTQIASAFTPSELGKGSETSPPAGQGCHKAASCTLIVRILYVYCTTMYIVTFPTFT